MIAVQVSFSNSNSNINRKEEATKDVFHFQVRKLKKETTTDPDRKPKKSKTICIAES